MQLTMQTIQAGVTSLWEVTLYPAAGQGGPPLWVVVTGRDSNQATVRCAWNRTQATSPAPSAASRAAR